MERKTSLTLSGIFLGVLLFFITLYPGFSTKLSLYSKYPTLFSESPAPAFTLAPIPYLNNTIIPPQLSAQSYVVFDIASGTTILGANEHLRRAPASTVKLAGALSALSIHQPEKIYTVKTEVVEEVTMKLARGEKISLLNLLYGSLINSANDAAQTIADNYPGGSDAFVMAMNTLAQKLHLSNTRFANPIGFDDPNQYSTAHDLALLGAYAMQHPLLSIITSTPSITVSNANFTTFHPLININELVGTIPGVGGAKTGKTGEAGENLITYYIYSTSHPLIIVVMGSYNRFEDTRALITYLNSALSYLPAPSIYGAATAGK